MYIKDVLLKYVQFSKYDVFLKVCKEIFRVKKYYVMLCHGSYIMKVTLCYVTVCLCCMYDGMICLIRYA